MYMADNMNIALFLFGLAIGLYLPSFPSPLVFLNTYLGLLLVVVGIVLLIKN